MLKNTLENILNNYININAAIITLVTIGLITIITIIAYSLERKLSNSSPLPQKILVHVTEGVVLTFSMILLQEIFSVINIGSINNGWLYANAQLTILLYCMYLIRNKITLLINILMPFAYYQAINIQRLNDRCLPVFAIAYFFLVIILIYIYREAEHLRNSKWKYLLLKTMFGFSWWILIWVDHSFPLFEVFNMLIVFLIYMAIILFYERQLEDTMLNYNDLKVQANYDKLTGIRNRANLDKTSEDIYSTYSHEEGVPLTVAMFDIDHFKNFNDKYGHSTGDKVLKHVAHTMEREMFLKHTNGQLFRFGGEEFIIIFRGKSPAKCIPIVSDLRNSLINSPLFLNGQKLEVTISFGVSQLRPEDTSFDNLFNRVDKYLYKSKNNGRNRLTVECITYDFDTIN